MPRRRPPVRIATRKVGVVAKSSQIVRNKQVSLHVDRVVDFGPIEGDVRDGAAAFS